MAGEEGVRGGDEILDVERLAQRPQHARDRSAASRRRRTRTWRAPRSRRGRVGCGARAGTRAVHEGHLEVQHHECGPRQAVELPERLRAVPRHARHGGRRPRAPPGAIRAGSARPRPAGCEAQGARAGRRVRPDRNMHIFPVLRRASGSGRSAADEPLLRPMLDSAAHRPCADPVAGNCAAVPALRVSTVPVAGLPLSAVDSGAARCGAALRSACASSTASAGSRSSQRSGEPRDLNSCSRAPGLTARR